MQVKEISVLEKKKKKKKKKTQRKTSEFHYSMTITISP